MNGARERRQALPLWASSTGTVCMRTAAGRHPLSFEQLTTIERHQAHRETLAYLQEACPQTHVLIPT